MMTSSSSQSRLRAFAAKVRGFLRGQQHDDEFDDEVQAHLQLLTDKLVQQGLSPRDAAAAARRQFGNTTLLQEDRREMQTLPSIEALWLDLRFALRCILRVFLGHFLLEQARAQNGQRACFIFLLRALIGDPHH